MKRAMKAFTLVEVILAVAIFSLILGIALALFKDFDRERKISLERANIDQKIEIFEKSLRDLINSSSLEIPSSSQAIDYLNSDLGVNDTTVKYFPTSIIVPYIYESDSRILRGIVVNNNNIIDNTIEIYDVRASGNSIIISTVRAPDGSLAFWSFRNIGNPRERLDMWVLLGNIGFPQNPTIIFDRSIIRRNGNYQVALRFFRPPLLNREIMIQTHGNLWVDNGQLVQLSRRNVPPIIRVTQLYDPSVLHCEVVVNLYDRGRRVFNYRRLLTLNVRYTTYR